MGRVLHTIPGMGSSQFIYPTSAASGAVMNNEATVNQYATRLTGEAVHVTNFVDLNSLSGPAKMSKVVVETSWAPLPSGGNMLRRQAIALYNLGPSVLYVHHNNTDAITEAFPVPVNGSLSLDFQSYHQLYGQVSSGSADVRIMEIM